MARKWLRIPAPAVEHDQAVWVLNYRKRPAQWERGVVLSLSYRPPMGNAAGAWTYDVRLDRQSYGGRGGYGRPIRLCVGDGAVRGDNGNP